MIFLFPSSLWPPRRISNTARRAKFVILKVKNAESERREATKMKYEEIHLSPQGFCVQLRNWQTFAPA
jgi:hypothetical protein